ncbi:MAG: alpha/beta hydrolase [Acetobacteraceae bacterium]|nr:alpha/beta hydrolase [Acetobacteraceae bacterium]
MLRRALAALAAPALAACSPLGLANALTPRGDVALAADIAHGPLPRHRHDLYRPAGLGAEAPLLVFIHGGNWQTGSRRDYGFVARPLARLGALVAVPDYRLWPEVAWPGFVEDTALAVRALSAAHPGRRLVLMGHSAGAYNAAAAALDPRWGAKPLVGGFIGLAGPYDFGAEEASPPAIFAASPRVVAAPDPLEGSCPLLLLHGAADVTVGPYHSRILAGRARRAGVPVRHVEYPGMGHIGIVAALAAPVRAVGLAQGDVLGEVRGFLAVQAS